jgi:hypothetical protein
MKKLPHSITTLLLFHYYHFPLTHRSILLVLMKLFQIRYTKLHYCLSMMIPYSTPTIH